MSLPSEALLAPGKRGTGIITGVSVQRRSLARRALTFVISVAVTIAALRLLQF